MWLSLTPRPTRPKGRGLPEGCGRIAIPFASHRLPAPTATRDRVRPCPGPGGRPGGSLFWDSVAELMDTTNAEGPAVAGGAFRKRLRRTKVLHHATELPPRQAGFPHPFHLRHLSDGRPRADRQGVQGAI